MLLHPDCAPPDPVWEDFLVTHLDLLAHYSDAVAGRWDPQWGVKQEAQDHLDRSLGLGISRFLQERCHDPRVICKTPRVENLEYFFRFFPQAKLLILVRDGRSIIESGARSFGWSREPALHLLDDAALAINAFRENAIGYEDRFQIIRYEDVFLDTENQLRKLFSFLELDLQNYDLQEALKLPVRGSSELKSGEDDSLHWDPVERSETFDPVSRFADWSDAMHYRYNRVAGHGMESLGYMRKEVKDPAGLYRLQSLFLDITWKLKMLVKPLYLRLFRS